jgi:hypothetical protein
MYIAVENICPNNEAMVPWSESAHWRLIVKKFLEKLWHDCRWYVAYFEAKISKIWKFEFFMIFLCFQLNFIQYMYDKVCSIYDILLSCDIAEKLMFFIKMAWKINLFNFCLKYMYHHSAQIFSHYVFDWRPWNYQRLFIIFSGKEYSKRFKNVFNIFFKSRYMFLFSILYLGLDIM